MVKIAHEAPLSIFDEVQALTDYDYALVHLFEENEEYWNKFVEAKAKGREIILDNSVFELEEAWDGDQYVEWVEKLQPDWYIIPDVLDDCDETIKSFDRFINDYPDLPGKAIAVAQGSTQEELIDCYNYLSQHSKVDKIGISFNHPFFQDVGHENQYFNMMMGRQIMLYEMVQNGIINEKKPHHLLGCGLPQEFKDYRDLKYKWIDSVDSSNPIIHGLKNIRYEDFGLTNKKSEKLFTLMNIQVDKSSYTWSCVKYNMKWFRRFVNG